MLKRSLIVFLAAAASFVVASAVWSVLNADLHLNNAYATAPSTAAPSTAAGSESFKTVHAPNQRTTRILAMDRAKHLAFWTLVLKAKKLACDAVVRTTYHGGAESGVDNWSIGCRDGSQYSVNIEPNAQGAVCTGNAFARSAE
ncbi:hypothetical protein [Afipia sp. GAS231]|uniref:hypothetical protein n=1 Tax=Afipia sp. GAS231 TaxID=1882747 RepID=UPI00087AA979|nr:hypothetical protein [Afipia sp. GAS231]SDP05566.1 hypothetical protein SAMN05444050_5719 [Afipia sp. GAS231]